MANKEPIFFWGHKPDPQNKHVFSQFYKCKFTDDDGYTYCCAEQYMMAGKALTFLDAHPGNQSILDEIMELKDPVKIKGMGRKIRGFSDHVWNQYREKIVCDGNYYKFSQNPNLKKILLETGDREIIEASPYDAIWGIGFDEQTAKTTHRSQWGLNLLGKAIMKVRTELKTI